MGAATKVVTAFAITFGAGLIGTFFVDASSGSWYASLAKPELNPPSSIFPIVWNLLYFLMSLALLIVWFPRPLSPLAAGWIRFYIVQLLFNAAWTVFFFGLHAILVALIDIFFLLFMVIALIMSGAGIDRRVPYLLIPYALWLAFATYLNLMIWLMN